MSRQILCEKCTLGYDGSAVTEELDFTVNSGDYLCILGENGSGKSTLVKALLGLKPQQSGKIEFCENMKAGEIGYLPQQTRVQRDFPASVREVVLSGQLGKCGLRPFYRKNEKERAAKAMERLGIKNLEKRCYRELSGGQQQRALLARALCATEKMLLLDEPVTGLDPKAQKDLYELIYSLNKKGITVIMVSHDVNCAIKYATHILHIGRKKQLFFGKKEDYIKTEIGKSFIITEGGESNG